MCLRGYAGRQGHILVFNTLLVVVVILSQSYYSLGLDDKCKTEQGAFQLGPYITPKGEGSFCFTIKADPSKCQHGDCTTVELDSISIALDVACCAPEAKIRATVLGAEHGDSNEVTAIGHHCGGSQGNVAQLRVQGMGLNITRANGARVCLHVEDGPCGTPDRFCLSPPSSPAGVCVSTLSDTTGGCYEASALYRALAPTDYGQGSDIELPSSELQVCLLVYNLQGDRSGTEDQPQSLSLQQQALIESYLEAELNAAPNTQRRHPLRRFIVTSSGTGIAQLCAALASVAVQVDHLATPTKQWVDGICSFAWEGASLAWILHTPLQRFESSLTCGPPPVWRPALETYGSSLQARSLRSAASSGSWSTPSPSCGVCVKVSTTLRGRPPPPFQISCGGAWQRLSTYMSQELPSLSILPRNLTLRFCYSGYASYEVDTDRNVIPDLPAISICARFYEKDFEPYARYPLEDLLLDPREWMAQLFGLSSTRGEACPYTARGLTFQVEAVGQDSCIFEMPARRTTCRQQGPSLAPPSPTPPPSPPSRPPSPTSPPRLPAPCRVCLQMGYAPPSRDITRPLIVPERQCSNIAEKLLGDFTSLMSGFEGAVITAPFKLKACPRDFVKEKPAYIVVCGQLTYATPESRTQLEALLRGTSLLVQWNQLIVPNCSTVPDLNGYAMRSSVIGYSGKDQCLFSEIQQDCQLSRPPPPRPPSPPPPVSPPPPAPTCEICFTLRFLGSGNQNLNRCDCLRQALASDGRSLANKADLIIESAPTDLHGWDFKTCLTNMDVAVCNKFLNSTCKQPSVLMFLTDTASRLVSLIPQPSFTPCVAFAPQVSSYNVTGTGLGLIVNYNIVSVPPPTGACPALSPWRVKAQAKVEPISPPSSLCFDLELRVPLSDTSAECFPGPNSGISLNANANALAGKVTTTRFQINNSSTWQNFSLTWVKPGVNGAWVGLGRGFWRGNTSRICYPFPLEITAEQLCPGNTCSITIFMSSSCMCIENVTLAEGNKKKK